MALPISYDVDAEINIKNCDKNPIGVINSGLEVTAWTP